MCHQPSWPIVPFRLLTIKLCQQYIPAVGATQPVDEMAHGVRRTGLTRRTCWASGMLWKSTVDDWGRGCTKQCQCSKHFVTRPSKSIWLLSTKCYSIISLIFITLTMLTWFIRLLTHWQSSFTYSFTEYNHHQGGEEVWIAVARHYRILVTFCCTRTHTMHGHTDAHTNMQTHTRTHTHTHTDPTNPSADRFQYNARGRVWWRSV